MTIEIDTHTHTIVSGHAYNSMQEMCRAAREKGLKGLAITEHGPEMPGGPHDYYFHNLKVVPRDYQDLRLLLGVELNLLNKDGDVDLPTEVLKKLDISIASVHSVCFKDEATVENVTEAYVRAMQNPMIDIIGHPDDDRFPVDYKKLVKAAKDTGTLLEVNNSSLSPNTFRENSDQNIRQMLQLCKEEGVRIVLSSDAHVDALIAEYSFGAKLIEETEFPEELIANRSISEFCEIIKHNKKR